VPALTRVLFFGVLGLLAACKPKVTVPQCEELVDRYATLVVTEKYPDASPALVHDEQQHAKDEARSNDVLRNCSSEVSRAEFECAMGAPTADAFEKCLE
jgi:hypothetical protein